MSWRNDADSHQKLGWRRHHSLLIAVVATLICFSGNPGVAETDREWVQLAHGFCIGAVEGQVQATDAVIAALEDHPQPIYPAVTEAARAALLNAPYTRYLQVGYTLEDGRVAELTSRDWVECEYGCVQSMYYSGRNYTGVCIKSICTEGAEADSRQFCDHTLGDDIYYNYVTFWCMRDPRASILCPAGTTCTQLDDESLECRALVSRGDQTTLSFSISAPADPSAPLEVVARLGGHRIASRPLSDLSWHQYIARNGPIRGDLASSYAHLTGLLSDLGTDASKPLGSATQARGMSQPSSWGSVCSVP